MITAAIYNKTTGIIERFVTCPDSMLELQAGAGEAVFVDCPASATHISEGKPVHIPPGTEFLLAAIKSRRNAMLTASDWTQLPDVPLTPEQKAEWAVYRQALRDFPDTCDPENPVWPTPPS